MVRTRRGRRPRAAAGTPGPGSRRRRGTAARRAHGERRRREHAVVEHERAVGEERREPDQDRDHRQHRDVEPPGREPQRPGTGGASVASTLVIPARYRTGRVHSGARLAGERMVRSPAVGFADGPQKELGLGEAHLRDRWCCLQPRQGPHRLLARAPAQVPWPAGHHAEARPVHQRRPRHDEPLPARRGVRHRGRRRDRPRPRALRALRRRPAHAEVERHDRVDLPGRARQGAARRLPGPDRPGDPAHHRRDQGPYPRPGRRRGRRRRDHRDRWHRRRHRDPAVPRGDPAVPQGRRPRQRVLRARHPGAVHRPVGRAEDQAHPALGHRAAQPRHPARRHRLPHRPPDPVAAEAEDLPALRRAGGRHRLLRRRPVAVRDPAGAARRGSRRLHLHTLHLVEHEPDLTDWRTLVSRVEAATEPVRIGLVGKYINLPDAYLSVVEALKHGGYAMRRGRSRSTGSRPTTSRGSSPKDDCATSTGRHPRRVRLPRHRGQDRGGRIRPGARGPVPRPLPRPAVRGHRVRPRTCAVWPVPTRASSTRTRRTR